MMPHLPLLSASAAIVALFYAAFPQPAPPAPIELRAGQVVSGNADIGDNGEMVIQGSQIRLVGLKLASPSEICAGHDGSTASCDASIARFLHEQSARDPVKCWMESDRSGTLSARCSIDGSDLNAMLVHAGLARADRLSATDYAELEIDAQKARAGLWKAAAERR